MVRSSHVLLACLALSATAGLARAEGADGIVWRGDFETGDLSQWNKVERVSDDRLEVVPGDPATTGGKYLLKTTVHQGDDPINASGNRNELVYTGDPASEEERFYRWRTMWPGDYASVEEWQLFTQWHHDGTSGSPPVELYVFGEEMRLRVNEEIVWTAPLERDKWRQFDLHVKWSADENEGFVELDVDGRNVLPRMNVATLYPGEGVYLKMGLYRDENVSEPQTIFHDGMTIATSKAALESSSPSTGGGGGPEWQYDESGALVGMTGASGSAGCDAPSASDAGIVALFGAGLVLVMQRRRRVAPVAVRK